jgi:DNA-binding GntR family transcriptional regulator
MDSANEPPRPSLYPLHGPPARQAFGAGSFVTQRELAQLACMPLGAIREMIPRVEAEGLLRSIPQRGLQVAHLDVAMVRDAFHLREIIEVEAIRHFVAWSM